MPDPRIRRPRPSAPRKKRPPDAAGPAETAPVEGLPDGAAATTPPASDELRPTERLEAVDAASAEAAAAALAAEDVAQDALPAGEPSSDAEAPEPAADSADVPAGDGPAEEPRGDESTEAGEEPAGWFRDDPLEGVAAAASSPTGVPADGAPPIPEMEEEAGDRDLPVAAPLASGEPPRGRRRMRGLLIGILTIIAVAAFGFVIGLMLPTVLPGPGIDTGGATPSVAPSATLAPTLAPSATPVPTATPTPSATREPTPEPTPASSPVTYIVKVGDQLQRIADRFGVTMKAIRELNSIDDPNLIRVGQKLLIPPPTKSPAP